eukprot:m.68982 g.68982  ORF g.68982 m.68982 type:complete len:200 (-) comp13709_c0_seq1:20-619(-)
MAIAIGQTSQAQKWDAAATQMTMAFRKYFVINNGTNQPYIAALLGQTGEDTWTPAGVMQAAHTVALFTDVLNDTSLAAEMLDYIFPDPDGMPSEGVQLWNNPTFLRRALKAMSHLNRTSRAIQHIKNRFAQYLPGSSEVCKPAFERVISKFLLLKFLLTSENDSSLSSSHGCNTICIEPHRPYFAGVWRPFARVLDIPN